jgi:putative oxidoreductase
MNVTTNRWNDRGLLFLRVAIGLVFVVHGWQKAFLMGPDGVAGFFGSIGIPFPYANAIFITGLELVGGLAVIAGALTRVVAPLLASTMAVAIWTVHLANGFSVGSGGYEFALVLLLANLSLAMMGAGAHSVDALVARRRASLAGSVGSLRAAA